MGARVKEIDRTYGHLARDSEDAIRARLDARARNLASTWRRSERRDRRLGRESRIGKSIERTGATGLEPATSGVTGRRSNQLNYAPERREIVAGNRTRAGGAGRLTW